MPNLLSTFKQFLLTLKLSPVSRKLYLSDVRHFLSWLGSEPTQGQLTSPKSYSSYLDHLRTQAIAPSMLKRTVASLRQFGTFISLTYSVENPVQLSSTTSNDYIKHFTNYLNTEHLSPLTIKSYKSDITRYFDWIGTHHASNKPAELLKEKNIKLYLNHLSDSATALPSTIERKLKSLDRFQTWYTNIYSNSPIADNNMMQQNSWLSRFRPAPHSRSEGLPPSQHSRSEGLPHSGSVNPDVTKFSVKNFNYRTIITLAVLLLFTSTLAIFGYRQFSQDVRLTAAYPNSPVTPNRQLSFQGRLENAAGTPITGPTDIVFKLWNQLTSGSELYSTGVCSIDPDTDGVFSTQIGSSCGAAIPATVFTENAGVWLEVIVGTSPSDETLAPRQPIASVAYALNSETIQGYPVSSTVSAIRNTIVPMNQWGEIIVGEQSPRLTGVSGTFQISAPSLSFTTVTGTNGNISLAPDGTGQVNLYGNTTTTNFFNVSNAQLTTGSLITGTAANNNSGFKLIDLLSGSSPTSKFSVTDTGLTTIVGDLYLSSGLSTFGTAVSDGTIEATKFCTGDGETNCVSDFAPILAGATIWTDAGAYVYPTAGESLGNSASAGSNKIAGLYLTDSSPLTFGTDNDIAFSFSGSELGITQGNNDVNFDGGTLFVDGSANNVGIGTTSPLANLDVNGTASVSGNLSFSGARSIVGTKMNTLTLGDAATGDLNFYSTANSLTSAGDLTLAGIITALTNETINGVDISAGTLSDIVNLTINAGGDLTIGTIGLNDVGSNNTTSGASLIGAFDEFDNSSSTTVQGVLNDLDTAIATGGVSSMWTLASGVVYPTTVTNDFALGGSTLAASMFGLDESAGNFYLGYDNSANPTLNFEATDADAGEFGFNTNDAFFFSNASVGIGTIAPDATSLLDLTSTTKGFLAPRMTGTQRDAISTPATGLMVYNTDTNQYNVYNGVSWGAMGSGGPGSGGSWWRVDSGALSPLNDTLDLLVGNIATASAKFSVNATSGNVTLTGGLIGGASSVINFPNFDVDTSGNTILTNQADLRLLESAGSGTNYTGFQAPATLAADYLYTMPDSFPIAASGYFLSSSDTGTLSWTNTVLASSVNFRDILGDGGAGSTNLSAAMIVGTGASLSYTGSGTIASTSLLGATWAAPGTIGSGTPNSGAFTTLSASGDITILQTTPTLNLFDSSAGEDDYSINVNTNAFNITNEVDSRVELSMDGAGGIDLGDNTATKTIRLGGNTSSAADTVQIATNATAADVIAIGNNNAATTLALTGGTAWNITTAGTAAFAGSLGIGTAIPTASWLNLAAATTAKSQLHLTSSSGTNPSSPADGDIWWNGTNLNFYNNATTTDLLFGVNIWTDAGTYLYPVGGETLGNSTSAGTNKIAGIYLADNAPLVFGTDNDNTIQFNGTLTTISGNTQFGNYAYFGGGTDYFVDNAGNAKFLDLQVADTGNPGITIGNGTIGFIKVGGSTISDNTGDLILDSDSSLVSIPDSATISGTLTVGNGTTNTIRSPFGGLNFDAKTAANTWTTAMTIDDLTGYVGIGTTSPGANLEILKTTNATINEITRLTNNGSGAGTGAALTFYDQNAQDGIINSAYTDAWTLNFGTSTSYLNTMTLKAGNVGIGTTAPGYNLDVAGNIKTTGQLYTAGAASTYGALSINGAKNGWGGINFRSGTTNLATFMVTANYQGAYNDADTGWDWLWLNGVLAAGSVPPAFIPAGTFSGQTYTFAGTGGTSPITPGLVVNSGTYGFMLFQNNHTGATATDGLYTGININEDTFVWNFENTGLIFGTNNTTQVTIAASGYVTFANGHNDLAENYLVSGKALRGSLVSIDKTQSKTVISSNPSHQSITGIVSTAPGAVMDEDGGFKIGSDTKSLYENERAPIALVGTAPTLITSQNGSINIGDAIGISSIPGFGAKMITAGQTVGKALEKIDTNSCSIASSIESIIWPEDDGKNTLKPCFLLPDGIVLGKIMVAVAPSWYDPNLTLTDTGDIKDQIQANVVKTDLISPLSPDQPIVINAPVRIQASSGAQTPPLGSSGALLEVDGEIMAATISARTAYLQNIQADTITARNIVADTISANHIEGLDAKLASMSGNLSDSQITTITDRIKARLALLTGNVPSAEDVPIPEGVSSSNGSELSAVCSGAQDSSEPCVATSSATLASADIDFVTVNNYLAVIGQAVITDLDVTGHLYATNISSKTGTLALGDNTLIIDSSGQVAINGDLTVSGKILAGSAGLGSLELGNAPSATSSALGKLLAIYNEQGIQVASIDASGSANLASLTTQLITIASASDASSSATPSALLATSTRSNATAGESKLVSPNTEITIESPYVTPNSLVYLTPTGNTEGKILFVKAKSDKSFTVGIDIPTSSDISFNWWIIQLSP